MPWYSVLYTRSYSLVLEVCRDIGSESPPEECVRDDARDNKSGKYVGELAKVTDTGLVAEAINAKRRRLKLRVWK